MSATPCPRAASAVATATLAVALASCRGVLDIEAIDYQSGGGQVDAGSAGGGGGHGGEGGVDAALPCPDVELSSDPHHCGACDQDCLDGECQAGHCQPWILAANELGARGLAVRADSDDSMLFWAREEPGGAIRMASALGGPATSLVQTPGAGVPVQVAIGYGSADSGWHPSIYYTVYSQLPDATLGLRRFVLDIANGKNQVLDDALLADGATYVGAWGVAADSDAGYFTARRDSTQVVRVDRTGAPIVPLYDSGAPEPSADDSVAVAIDQDSVYWALAVAGEIRRVGKDGAGAVVLAQDQLHPTAIAVAGKFVYWTTEVPAGDETIVRRRPRDGSGSVEDVCSTKPVAAAMAVDATNVYLIGPGTAPGTGTLRRARLDGSMPVADVLVSGLSDPRSLGLGADAVYWTDREAGTVSKLAKPAH